ncbi:MAG: hypothetical protein V1933_02350, partial [Candidatus Omnitrophota bacterium]
GLGLTPSSLGRSFSANAVVRFGFVFGAFWVGQNAPNTLRPLPRKNPEYKSLYILRRRPKNF